MTTFRLMVAGTGLALVAFSLPTPLQVVTLNVAAQAPDTYYCKQTTDRGCAVVPTNHCGSGNEFPESDRWCSRCANHTQWKWEAKVCGAGTTANPSCTTQTVSCGVEQRTPCNSDGSCGNQYINTAANCTPANTTGAVGAQSCT